MPDFSPAAQAIVNAAVEAGGGYGRATPTLHARLAAALRAAADQVVPEEPDLSPEEASDLVIWGKWRQRTKTRDRFLAIIAELETSTAENLDD
jgi:hypothetical protein